MTTPTISASSDLNAVMLAAALARRGVASTTIVGRRNAEKAHLEWLRFEVNGRLYHYRRGVLVEGGELACDEPNVHVNRKAVPITSSKSATKALLSRAGVAVPVGATFGAEEAGPAMACFRALGRPACVKPDRGGRGEGVMTHLASETAFAEAFAQAASRCSRVVVEACVEGEAMRFFYVAPRVVAVKVGHPASVVGDGVSPLRDLIVRENARREASPTLGLGAIAMDAALDFYLAARRLALSDVPAEGERVNMREVSNWMAGAVSSTCADSTHPSYLEVAQRACEALPGLLVAGVDMMIRDRRQPAAPGNHHVLEINSSPSVLPFYFPHEGTVHDVCGDMVDLLLSRSPGPRIDRLCNYLDK